MTKAPTFFAVPQRAVDPSICRWCRWWGGAPAGRPDSGTFACVRHAPVVIPPPVDAVGFARYGRTTWPETTPGQHCGDFERFLDPDGTPNRDVHGEN